MPQETEWGFSTLVLGAENSKILKEFTFGWWYAK